MKKFWLCIIFSAFCLNVWAADGCLFKTDRQMRRQKEIEKMQEEFRWWPTDALPGPVKDEKRSGYWWWPQKPGTQRPWGNRGYIYLYKIIYDYKEEELGAAKAGELRPALLIKKIIKNVKIYFDFDKSNLRPDHTAILNAAVKTLARNPQADILITGNCDVRGPESYNLKLGRQRAEAVKNFMLEKGIEPGRIRIISRGKLDAIAPITDLVGMQKDRNAQFVIAEVEEVMLPSPEGKIYGAQKIEEGKYLTEEKEEVESSIQVDTKEYIVQKGDTLWKIAEKELGKGYRWKYIYELNKERIKDPNRLKAGTKIIIPVE